MASDDSTARDGLVDGAMAVALTTIAVTTLYGTFDGWGFLIVAAVAALSGVLSVALVNYFRLPVVLALVPMTLSTLVLGPALTLRGSPVGPWPTPGAWAQLWDVALHGWKDILTTLPPVAPMGRLSFLVYLIAILSGAVSFGIARRTDAAFLPILGPAGALAASAYLGLPDPTGTVIRGVLLALGAVIWSALRQRRQIVSTGGQRSRFVGSAGLLAVAGVAAVVGTTALAPTEVTRDVARSTVVPPVGITDKVSPLAGFRQLAPQRKELADKELLTVSGVEPGTRVRLAVLDWYSGTVWAAGDGAAGQSGSGFLRIGNRIPEDREGPPLNATIKISQDYASSDALRWWVPTIGYVTSIEFAGTSGWRRQEELRYNPQARSTLVLGGLNPGEAYSVKAVNAKDPKPAAGKPVGSAVDPGFSSVTRTFVEESGDAGGGAQDKLDAVAEQLRSKGAYTDGVGAESRFAAGHSVGRISTFLSRKEPAGNDEQYAGAFALAAANLGFPSRVVMMGTTNADGAVIGRDVRAYVEVQTSPTVWRTYAPEEFMPDRSKKPKADDETQPDQASRAIVPPPNAQKPPSSTDQFDLDTTSSARGKGVEASLFNLPPWAKALLIAAGVPLALLALWAVLIVGAKFIRRRRRRRRGGPIERVESAWDELVDTLVDARLPVSRRQTRVEAGAASGMPAAVSLAHRADGLTFGPYRAQDEDAEAYWDRMGVTQVAVRGEGSLLERARTWLTPRSLLPITGDGTDRNAPSTLYSRLTGGEYIADPTVLVPGGGFEMSMEDEDRLATHL